MNVYGYKFLQEFQGLEEQGTPVKFRDGPAAVSYLQNVLTKLFAFCEFDLLLPEVPLLDLLG